MPLSAEEVGATRCDRGRRCGRGRRHPHLRQLVVGTIEVSDACGRLGP